MTTNKPFGLVLGSEGRAWTSRHQSFSARAFQSIPFSGTPVLAALLGIPSQEGRGLAASFQDLPEKNKQELRERWGASTLEGMFWIAQENVPEMFWEQILHLATNLTQERKFSEALALYQGILSSPEQGDTRDLAPPSREQIVRATREAQAILGQGPSGARTEILLGGILEEAKDPANILPALGGSLFYQVGRASILTRLGALPRGSFFSSGLAARFSASALALGLEVPSFYLLSRGVQTLQGRPFHASASDFASLALSLGTFKLFGYFANQFLEYQGLASWGTSSQGALALRSLQVGLPAMAQISGLVVARRLESRLGLRPKLEGATLWTDALASYLSLSVGGHLAAKILGPGFSSFEKELNFRAKLYSEGVLRSNFEPQENQKISAFLPIAPAPMMIFASGWGFERWFRWLKEGKEPQDIFSHGEGPKLLSASTSSPDRPITIEEKSQLRRIFLRYPHVRKAMDKAKFSLEERREVLNLIMERSSIDVEMGMKYLSPAIRAMTKAGWTYEMQRHILGRLCAEAQYGTPLFKFLPEALIALKQGNWTGDQNFQAILSLIGAAGHDIDLIFPKMTKAFQELKKTAWTWEQQFQLILGMVEHGAAKAGQAMDHFGNTIHVLNSIHWNFEETSHLFNLLVLHAPRERDVEDYFEESFPYLLLQMDKFSWSPLEKFAWVHKLLGDGSSNLNMVLEFLPGVLSTLRPMGWSSEQIRLFFPELVERNRNTFGRVLRMTPYLVQNMSMQGRDVESQREMLLTLADHAGASPDLAILEFLWRLLPQVKPLNSKPN